MPKTGAGLGGEYYNDFLKTLEIHSVLFIRLALHGPRRLRVQLSIGVAGKDQFGTAEREFVGRIHRHLIRAFELSERLVAPPPWGPDSKASSTSLPRRSIFLLDRNCRILRVNPAGERIVGAAKGLFACGGRLSAAAPEVNKRLRGLVAMAACADHARSFEGAARWPCLPPPAACRSRSWPRRCKRGRCLSSPVGPCALVCVTADLECGRVPTVESLRDLFGLTAAEARVALALTEGLSPAEAAERLKVSSNTVRVHLARIFDKTGTRRQSELARLMTRTVGLQLT